MLSKKYNPCIWLVSTQLDLCHELGFKHSNFDWKLAEVCLVFKKDKNKLNFKSDISRLHLIKKVGRQIDVLNQFKHILLFSSKICIQLFQKRLLL